MRISRHLIMAAAVVTLAGCTDSIRTTARQNGRFEKYQEEIDEIAKALRPGTPRKTVEDLLGPGVYGSENTSIYQFGTSELTIFYDATKHEEPLLDFRFVER